MLSTSPGRMSIGKEVGDVSDATLRFLRQIGVEHVGLPAQPSTEPALSRPVVPPPQSGPAGAQPPPWDAAVLRGVRNRVVRYGLVASAIALPISGNILLGLPGADADLVAVRHSIEAASRAGFKVVTYNFTALRASEGYRLLEGRGRGGSRVRSFSAARIEGLPPLPSVGRHTRDEMWERLIEFLRIAVPIAETAGIRLAGHPNDPPVAEYRGVAQPIRTLDDIKRLVAVVDSPSNSVYVDTGVLTEMEEDAPAAIRWLGQRDRIGAVHFRNVHVEVPFERYVETFLDEGDCDMPACMRALHEVKFAGMLEPDHTPGIHGDTSDTWIGWAFAIGQIIALRNAIERNAT